MTRYVFFAPELQSLAQMRAAISAAKQCAEVVKVAAGTMLIEVEPDRLPQLSAVLPGWQHSVERLGYRLPERRSRLKGTSLDG